MQIQSGVAFRLLAGLTIMAVLAIAASLIGHYAVDGYKEPFRLTATVDLPNLVATSRLAQDAVSLTANAPTLVLAKSQTARHIALAHLEAQIGTIRSLVNRFAGADIAADTIASIVSQSELLIDNLKLLDYRVDQRLELDHTLAGTLDKARALQQAIIEAAAPEAAGALVRDWQLTAQHALILLILATNETQQADLEARRTGIAPAIAQASERLARLPPALAQSLRPLEHQLERSPIR